jgi:hypothetical protein
MGPPEFLRTSGGGPPAVPAPKHDRHGCGRGTFQPAALQNGRIK